MKLGKMLSVGEVVEQPAPEDKTVAEPAPVSSPAERATDSEHDLPAPEPVVIHVDG